MNNYHIYQQQAKGKYSVIFKARKKKSLQFVAIKRLQKSRLSKVIRESQILPLLSHPSIIKFHCYIQTKNHIWQITQYCPGGDLLKLIQYDKLYEQSIIWTWMIQLINAVGYCHSNAVIVGDIRPAGVLVNQYGKLKLGDFGQARTLKEMRDTKDNERKKGTPSYMAPQLFQINGVYSFQTDFWALGCLMYELGQGNPPFVSTDFQQIAQLAKTAPTPKIDHFTSDFNNLLSRFLEKNPSRRITWKQLINHPWVRKQLQDIDMPIQQHFIEYEREKNKYKGEKLRVSQNFQNYNNKALANDRRQQFQFQPNHLIQYQIQQNQMEQQQKQKHYSIRTQEIKNQPYKKLSTLQDSTTINQFLQTPTSKPSLPLQQVINHQSDTAVKPIIGNKDIQLISSSTFNPKQLGFTYIQPQVLADGILNGQMQPHLNKILQGMKGDDKLNVLGYFQTIVQNSQVANYLFKTQFIQYYMSLVKGYKQSGLRAKICQILGFLIRHATAIDSDILKFGIISGFVQAITKDKSQKVRRKAMAALGELLFYGATQVDEDALEWDIPLSLISTLLKVLKNNSQDQVVRLYCCKSIQNITAQAQKVGLNFSQIDTLMVMMNCFNTTRNQSFRTSILFTIHHMICLNSTLRQIYLQKTPNQSIIQYLSDPQTSPKSIQIILWIFLQQCLKSPKSKQSKLLLQNSGLIKCILKLLECSSSVIKGRIYLMVYFVVKEDVRRLKLLGETKFWTGVERQDKEQGKYEAQALQFVLAFVYQHFQKIIQLAHDQLQAVVSNQSQVQKPNYILIIFQMQTCSVFEQLFMNFSFIWSLTQMLNLLQAAQNKGYLQVFKNQYYIILQRILSCPITCQRIQQLLVQKIVPFLIGKLLKSPSLDIKFSCIKYILLITNFILSQQFIYDSTILSSTSKKLTQLLEEYLIKNMDQLFIRQIAARNILWKLMEGLFRNRQGMVKKFWQTNHIPNFIEEFNYHSQLNVLRTIELIVDVPQDVTKLDVIQTIFYKTVSIFTEYKKQNNQLFFEYPLSILSNILVQNTVLKIQKCQIDNIFQNTISLQSHQDLIVRQKAQKLIEICLNKKMFSQKSIDDWKCLSKKGMENYQKFVKLSGLKSKIKPTETKDVRTQRQSRYR